MHQLPIDQSKVDELIRQCKHFNVFAIHLPSYYYGNRRKSNPIITLMTELIAGCVEYLEALTFEEIRNLVNSIPLSGRIFIGYDEISETDFSAERVAIGYLIAAVQEGYLSFKQIISSEIENSKLLQEYPEIKEKLDDDNLLILDRDLIPSPYGIEYKNHIFQYHQFLRRKYRANPNFDFLGRFTKNYSQSDGVNKFRIAIDFHRLMPKEALQHIMELDAWFGATFDKNKLDDPNSIGLTVVKRDKPSIFDVQNELDRTEFYWSRKNEIKTLEIEELSREGYIFDSYYLNKYIHSERDINQQELRHFDGAVKVYLQDKYKDRLMSKMPTEPKSFTKIKLFRIDGNIDVDEWLDLISFFYRGNEMIMEYFNPKQFESLFGERIQEFKNHQQKAERG